MYISVEYYHMTQKIQALELSLSNQSNEQKNCALQPNGTLKNAS